MNLFEHLASGRLLHTHHCAYHAAEAPRDVACDCGASRLERLARQALADNAWTIGHVERVLEAEELSQAHRAIIRDDAIAADDPRCAEACTAAYKAWQRADLE